VLLVVWVLHMLLLLPLVRLVLAQLALLPQQ
jgi:hypothetical protein